MPALKNAKHELFASYIASGFSNAQAYVKAGYAEKQAEFNGSRLRNTEKVSSRIAELAPVITTRVEQAVAKAVEAEVQTRAGRVLSAIGDLQALEQVIAERAIFAEHQDVPGGSTGYVVTTYKQVGTIKKLDKKTKAVTIEPKLFKEHAVDVKMIEKRIELRKQIAIELGQWVEKRDIERKVTLADVPTDELRERSAAMKAKLPPELLEALELAQKQVIQ